MPGVESDLISSFEEQFSGKQTVEFPEGKVDVVDIIPPQFSDPVPVLLAPGWSENPDTYKKSLQVISDAERRVLTVGYHRRGGETELHETFPQAELRKASQLLQVLNLKEIGQVDGIFHSEGAINGLIAAMIEPTRFRNIVLDKPSGFIGEDGNARLAGRFLKLLLQEAIQRKPFSLTDPTNSLSSSLRTLHYMAGNPLRVLEEMSVMTSEDITKMIYYQEGKGIKFSIIAGVDDPLYPVKRQIEHLRKTKKETGKSVPIEGFYSVTGGHNELSIHADQHTALAIDALNGLQRRRERLESS